MEQEYNATPEVASEHLFEDYQEPTRQAATGQRFVNWLIDNLLMRFGLSYLTGTALGYVIANFFPDFAFRISYEQDRKILLLMAYILVLLNYLLYYTVCEKAFKGYTLGKLVSGTRAIRDDGGELTLKDAFLRSASRLVPLEFLSGFGRPWHDSWTRTQVIQVR